MQNVLILNATAGLFRHVPDELRRSKLAEVETWVSGRAQLCVCETLQDLDNVLEQLDPQRCRWVALAGGDGTFLHGISGLVRRFAFDTPPIALLPAGTVATGAKNFGLRGPLKSAVRRLLEDPISPLPRVSRPTLLVRSAGTTQVGFTMGTGLVARFFQHYYDQGAGGIPTAARIFSRVFAGSFLNSAFSRGILDPLPCQISIEGKPCTSSAYSLVVASVFRDLGMGLQVTYRAGEDPNRLHLVASPLPGKQLGPQAPRVLLGRPLRGSGHIDALVQDFELAFPEPGGPYVLDGELLQSQRVQVAPGPRLALLSDR